jgi:Ribbon-helix-helix domain
MYAYIMSHRTQIILTDAQYARLKRESARTGVPLGELIRRALASVYGEVGRADAAEILGDSFGAWRDRELDGAEYVEGLRRGMARRLGR